MINDLPVALVIDGRSVPLGMESAEPLVRAVLISLFTWRRAQPADVLPAGDRFGWWGDSFAAVPGDRIGSRLWLLSRAKLLPETAAQAKEYARESLQWLLDDGVAAKVEVEAERQGLSTLVLACRIYKSGAANNAPPVSIRFTDVWEFLQNV